MLYRLGVFFTLVVAVHSRDGECMSGAYNGRRVASACLPQTETPPVHPRNLTVNCSAGLLVVYRVEYGRSLSDACFGVNGETLCTKSDSEYPKVVCDTPTDVDSKQPCRHELTLKTELVQLSCGIATYMQVEYECVMETSYWDVCSSKVNVTRTGFISNLQTDRDECRCELKFHTGGFVSPSVTVVLLQSNVYQDQLKVYQRFISNVTLNNTLGKVEYDFVQFSPVNIDFNRNGSSGKFLLYYQADLPLTVRCRTKSKPVNVSCPIKWTENGTECIKYSGLYDDGSWTKVRSRCLSCGADLFNARSKAQQAAALRPMPEFTTIWSGAHFREGKWMFTDGSQFNISRSNNPGNCLTLERPSASYKPFIWGANCGLSHEFVCSIPIENLADEDVMHAITGCSEHIADPQEAVTQAENNTGSCPNGWIHYVSDSKCLLVSFSLMTWQQALNYCQAENSHLLSLRSQNELKLLGVIIQAFSIMGMDKTDGNYWSGLHLKNNSNYTWEWTYGARLDENINKTMWSPNEPNHEESERCGQIRVDGSFNDYNCSFVNHVICERPPEFKTSSCYAFPTRSTTAQSTIPTSQSSVTKPTSQTSVTKATSQTTAAIQANTTWISSTKIFTSTLTTSHRQSARYHWALPLYISVGGLASVVVVIAIIACCCRERVARCCFTCWSGRTYSSLEDQSRVRLTSSNYAI